MAILRTAVVGVVLGLLAMMYSAVSAVCTDTRTDCDYFKNQCGMSNIKAVCQKTCSACENGDKEKRDRDTTTANTASRSTADCTDLRDDCSSYKNRCKENWMTESCRKTCLLCSDSRSANEGARQEPTTYRASTTTAELCLMAPPGGNCSVQRTAWYYEPLEGECRTFIYGGCHGNYNIFETENDCNKYCRAYDICRKPNGARGCTPQQPRYYYDSDADECRQYSGCDVSLNNFISLDACQRKCGPEPSAGKTREACNLDRHHGVTCTDRFTSRNTYWYYDNKSGRCQQFTYTGCGGNKNQFNTEHDCTALCSMSVSTTPTPQTAQDGSGQDSSLSFIGLAIAVLVLAFIAASIVFIIKRRRGATKESTGNKRNVYDTAPPGVNAEEPTYCNVTTQSVTSACASDNNIYINIENNTSTKDSSEPATNKGPDENTQNDLYAVVEKTRKPGFSENRERQGTSKGPDEDTQNVLYATVDKSRKPSSADNTEKPSKPVVMPEPTRKGAAGCKPQENGGDGLSANTTATTQPGGVKNVVNNNEAGSSDSQKATVNEEGLFYTAVDFSQYQPEMQ